MFIGHLAVGFAAKRAAPRAGLGALMAAPILLDLIWPVLVLTTRARDRTGALALWVFVAFQSLVYVGNVVGPPPPSEAAVAWLALAQWLWIPWAAWIDRHREPRLQGVAGALAT